MPVQPSTYSACSILACTGIGADANLLLAAASGRRLIGFSTSLPVSGGNFRGRIVKGAVASSVTGRLHDFELTSNEESFQWLWPGVDVSDGVSIDKVNGNTCDLTLFYVDVT